ncbi:MAG: UDP-N-acetylglucosamine--N-acetylmuramyl-(pentapeptide) pyrophosphoryl-undecaprenol N-acetylglucosamine transferase [Porticoccaceae bacterium]|nr:MAG: UDP-N-acetylglucosamine--N-acetylmuramyl-(pentapeptide) pyrophosphoryl-undecaprenol N-acetylglucosamine transferase [Porticoccaceae bacterium]
MVRGSAVILAGGTGGHVFPALALAEALARQGVAVDWVGTAQGIEARLVPAAGYPLHTLDAAGLRGVGFARRMRAAWGLTRALGQALRLLRRLRPGLAVGFGGYAAAPGGLAAKLLGIPLVIHEQNAVAGTTNRLLARFARRVATAFPGVLPRGELVGNPVRPAIAALPPPEVRGVGSRRPLRLLVLGGSQGAATLNRLLPEALALCRGVTFAVRHQCGVRHLEATRAAYRAAGVEAEVVPFVEEMAEALGWADLAVARAGALTVAELAAAGLGALLVPFPAAIDDHQTANARWLVEAGAARLLPERELTAAGLAAELGGLAAEPARLAAMAAAARARALSDAAERLAAICLEEMR